MPTSPVNAPSSAGARPSLHLVFDACNRLAVRRTGERWDWELGAAGAANRDFATLFPRTTPPQVLGEIQLGAGAAELVGVRAEAPATDPAIEFHTIEELERLTERTTPELADLLRQLAPHLARIAYLHLGESDFIYKFRPEKERNLSIYSQDPEASRLYRSQLCEALKHVSRQQERAAGQPVVLDFGAVQYVLPSHFGFCLGVKNAIERAYETLAGNPGRRIFMLSELIHNSFVNADLLRRGLRYLQTEKGVPYTVAGPVATGAAGERLWWDALQPDDIVIVPAFGATNEDKRRLVRQGIAVARHDATCMLVEKVWKAARAYGREGYTIVIHGKHEHEETKATFSNTQQFAPALIVRHLEEARQLGQIIASTDPARRARFHELFAGRYTPGFDVDRHLERIAVVNQTTLLMNETLAITEHLREVYRARYGDPERVGGKQRRDTLCYATQVNQDALTRALAEPLDAALVIGGKNSSNTYQLYRLCADRLGAAAHFIQSETSLHSVAEVEHYVFPAKIPGAKAGSIEVRPLWTSDHPRPRRILITGGASCPDGIIQQVIVRVNQLLPAASLRPMDEVLRQIAQEAAG